MVTIIIIGVGMSEPLPCRCQWRSCTCVCTYVRPRPTATLRMRERCSNSAVLAGFRNQLVLELFVSDLLLEMSQTQQESDRQKRRYFPQTNHNFMVVYGIHPCIYNVIHNRLGLLFSNAPETYLCSVTCVYKECVASQSYRG